MLGSTGGQPQGRTLLAVPGSWSQSRCGAGGGCWQAVTIPARPQRAGSGSELAGGRKAREHLVTGRGTGKCAELWEEALAAQPGAERAPASLLHCSCARAWQGAEAPTRLHGHPSR